MEQDFILYTAVSRLAQLTQSFSDADMGQPYGWGKHSEGVRLAYLGTYHELRDLATLLSQKRVEAGLTETAVQRILAQNHLGYRDLQAILVGVTAEIYDQVPAVAEWSLRTILEHIVAAERTFFALAHVGLEVYRQSKPLASFPKDAPQKLFGPDETFFKTLDEGTLDEVLALYEQIHFRSWSAFADMTNEEINAPTPLWWEEEIYSIQYRLRRFDVHLRQHLIQAEKALHTLGHPANEVKRLLRQVYAALAEVEGLLLGAPQLALAERQALADVITQRADDITAIVQGVHELETAVKRGDSETVQSLLAAKPTLKDGKDSNGVPLLLTALYHQKGEIAQQLVAHGATLSIHSAAAYGDLVSVQKLVTEWARRMNHVAVDGFTPLQLACFFNREDVALWLIAEGAEVTAVSQNDLNIQPIHAACSANNLNVVRALLENGADVNAKQANDFTPLHTAADHNAVDLAKLLLEYGANKTAVTKDGKTAYDCATEKGNGAVLDLLQ